MEDRAEGTAGAWRAGRDEALEAHEPTAPTIGHSLIK